MPRHRLPFGPAVVVLALATIVMGCGELATPTPTAPGVFIESAPVTATPAVRVGGKPATPPGTPSAESDTAATQTPDSDVLAATAARDGPTGTPAAGSPTPEATPIVGRWIDVDVTNFVVRLMDGGNVVRTIQPVAVGAEVDTGNFASTQTGLFHVYNKIPGLQYDAPYSAYISDWVGFDIDKANGFHSFLKDKDGQDTVTSTGRVSNGCIRTGASSDIYAYAEIGMPVLVHA